MRRQAIHGIFKGLMEEEGVFTVQVDGALVMGQRLARGSIGCCQEVGQPVHSHIDLGNRRLGVQLSNSLCKPLWKPLLEGEVSEKGLRERLSFLLRLVFQLLPLETLFIPQHSVKTTFSVKPSWIPSHSHSPPLLCALPAVLGTQLTPG